MRIWLKKEAAALIADLKGASKEGESFHYDSPKVLVGDWGIKMSYDFNSGRWFVDFDEDLSPLPEIPREKIESVTMHDTAEGSFRREGVYSKEGAQLILKTHRNVVNLGDGTWPGDAELVTTQEISVSGPSVEAVKQIYTLVRQRKLDPGEDWDRPSSPPAELKAAAPIDPSTV